MSLAPKLRCDYCDREMDYEYPVGTDTAGKTLFGAVVAIRAESGVVYAHEGCWWKNRPKRLPVQQALGEVG